MSAEIIQFGGTRSPKPRTGHRSVQREAELDVDFVARAAAAHRKFNERRVTCSVGKYSYRVTFDHDWNLKRVETVNRRVLHGRLNVYHRTARRFPDELIEIARAHLAAGRSDADQTIPESEVEEIRARQTFYREKAARHLEEAAECNHLADALEAEITS